MENRVKKLAEAYIVGVMYGDGTLNKTSRVKNRRTYEGYRVKLAVVDRDFIDLYEQTLNVLGLSCNISIDTRSNPKHKDQISAVSQDRKTYEYINNIKKSYKVKKMSKIELVMFLKGIFDSEGSVARKELTLSISQNLNSPATPLLEFTLNRLGIKYSYYTYGRRGLGKHSECYFNIFGNEAKKLHTLFGGFTIKRKEERFSNNLISQKQIQWSDEHTLLLANLKKKGLDYEAIAKQLGKSKSAIAHKVFRIGLSRRKQNDRTTIN